MNTGSPGRAERRRKSEVVSTNARRIRRDLLVGNDVKVKEVAGSVGGVRHLRNFCAAPNRGRLMNHFPDGFGRRSASM